MPSREVLNLAVAQEGLDPLTWYSLVSTSKRVNGGWFGMRFLSSIPSLERRAQQEIFELGE